jgi:hypothetical protein
MADPKGMESVPDGVAISAENVISVEMEDLSEKDQDELERELQRELEEFMAERRKKLACFQKTRGGVVKKGDTTKAPVPVNSPFTLEELVYMIDISVNSKYGGRLGRDYPHYNGQCSRVIGVVTARVQAGVRGLA